MPTKEARDSTDPANPYDRYSARLDEIFVELHDYAYFHSPSDPEQIDRRFTGRIEVLERLKSLLTDYETPSGAYLVTGFRGAGKSSLVAKALSELDPPWTWGVDLYRFVLLLAITVSAALLDPSVWLRWLAGGIALVTLAWAAWLDPRWPDLPARRLRGNFGAALARAFVLEPRQAPRDRLRTVLQGILISATVTVILSFLRFEVLALRALAALVGLLIFTHAIPGGIGLQQEWGRYRAKIWRRIHWRIRCLISFSRRVPVHINLSQDSLREIDVLRAIARALQIGYARFGKPHHVLPRLLVTLPFFMLVIHLHERVDRWLGDFEADFHLACYFPSQGELFLPKRIDENGRNVYWSVLHEHLEQGPAKRIEWNRSNAALLRSRLEAEASERSWTPPVGPPCTWEHAIGREHFFDHRYRCGFAGRVQELVANAATHADTLLQRSYNGVRHNIVEPMSTLPLLSIIPTPPPTLDYLLLLYLGLGLLVPSWFFLLPGIDRYSRRQVMRRLEELNQMIGAEITRERGGVPIPANTLLSLSFGRRQRETFATLNERDIEERLIDILSMFRRLTPMEVRPEFIIIFDELDKIRQHPIDDAGASDEALIAEASHEDRHRQQRILSLVSNMKHFLSTAPVKFIFVAGREMFDAALADVSDRNFFMGSVFNEVLQVPSFHSDGSDERLPDITSLPEQYLCRFLIPWHWHQGASERLNLAQYRRYLEEESLGPEQGRLRGLDPAESSVLREKVLYELHNFVTYLSYRSNGAPKKITKTVERHVVRIDHSDSTAARGVVVGRSQRNLYLRFGYYEQYTFALVTYLASPLIFSLNRAIKDYGDKILVSSSFLLDNIFKFHGSGFSWRNLELLPEVVDVNRSPQLRPLIADIMRFLSKSHIVEIMSGLYHFKFSRRITEEIAFLSKLSEHESAAFNFTLDEALPVKRHFYEQLRQLLATYDHYPNLGRDGAKAELVYALAFVRMILGDLHLYDGELDNAIIEYMEAVQVMRAHDFENGRVDMLVLMIRNFLKLGLTYEYKGSYDSAFVTYGRVSALVAEIASRLGPEEGDSGADETQSRYENLLIRTVFEGVRLVYQPMFARFQLIEKSSLGGIGYRDLERLEEEAQTVLGWAKDDRFLLETEYRTKVANILYFKNGPMPTGSNDPNGMEEHARAYCWKPTAICAKNRHCKSLIQAQRRLPCLACGYYNRALERLCEGYLEIRPERLRQGRALPEIMGRFGQIRNGLPHRTISDRANYLRELSEILTQVGDVYLSCAHPEHSPVGEDVLRFLPDLACVDLHLENRDPDGACSDGTSARLQKLWESRPQGFSKLEEALLHYACSAAIYQLESNHRAGATQISKILWLLREMLSVERARAAKDPGSSRIEELKATLLDPVSGGGSAGSVIDRLGREALKELFRSHEGTHRLEIEKIKEIMVDVDERHQKKAANLRRLSINVNTTEILVLLHEIRLFLADGVVTLDTFNSPTGMFHSVYSRIHGLRLRSKIHRHNVRVTGLDRALRQFFPKEEAGQDPRPLESLLQGLPEKLEGWIETGQVPDADGEPRRLGPQMLEFMITDALYCCHEIVRMLHLYGHSYMASHSMKSNAHRDLAFWSNAFFAYRRFATSSREWTNRVAPRPIDIPSSRSRALHRRLEQLLGKADMVSLRPNFHREKALHELRSALSTHREGRAYREKIEDKYYLDDDFADQLEHFCAALERYFINSGRVDRQIAQLTRESRSTSLYAPESFDAQLGPT